MAPPGGRTRFFSFFSGASDERSQENAKRSGRLSARNRKKEEKREKRGKYYCAMSIFSAGAGILDRFLRDSVINIRDNCMMSTFSAVGITDTFRRDFVINVREHCMMSPFFATERITHRFRHVRCSFFPLLR